VEPFQQQKQQIASVMGNVSRLSFLYMPLQAERCTAGHSLAYKS